MTPGPIIKTFGEPRGRKGAVCLVLTNAQALDVPQGFTIAAGAARRALIPGGPPAVIDASLWPQWETAAMFAVLLVSSVAARVLSTGSPDIPNPMHLSPRASFCWRMGPATRLSVYAAQGRAGELYAVPLKVSDPEAASQTYLGASLIPRARLLAVEAC